MNKLDHIPLHMHMELVAIPHFMLMVSAKFETTVHPHTDIHCWTNSLVAVSCLGPLTTMNISINMTLLHAMIVVLLQYLEYTEPLNTKKQML